MNLQPKLLQLLNKRGICTETEIVEFLSDKPQMTYDPFLLLNMAAGVDLILSAIEMDKRICIYGDYDADGITSTAVMLQVLGKMTTNLTYYIPSRFDEGYGLNCQALDKIKMDGADLVITVDCGSVSCEEVEHGKAIGLEILVTDHHTITDRIADCLVINPKQPGCPYPFKHLAGVGVAFKLAQAIATQAELPKEVVNRTLDLVGIGTIGDVVSLTGENRTLAKYGIRAINLSKRKGLERLLEGVRLPKGQIKAENVAYIIVPHLNAAGRMANAGLGVSLLNGDQDIAIAEHVEKLIHCNNERKNIQNETYEECRKKLEERHKTDLFYVIDLAEAHEGITGIVAGKIKETYGKPAIIVTPTGNNCLKGTGRSIEGINLYDLLKRNEHLFQRFGGHAAACGFTMKKENLQTLRENLNQAVENLLVQDPDLFDQSLLVDMILQADDVSMELVDDFKQLEPFGCDNPPPLVAVKGKPSAIRKMGSDGQYTKFIAVMENQRELQCVIFNRAEEYDEILQKNKNLSIMGTLGSQSWNGKQYLQLTVLGIEK